jgi:hypothetical protein
MSRIFTLADKRTGEVVFEGTEANRSNPCWVCGALHTVQGWCLLDRSRRIAICPRVESARRVGEAGWWHGSNDAPGAFVPCKAFEEQYPAVDWERRWALARTACTRSDTERLSATLKIPASMIEAAVEVGTEPGRAGSGSFAFAMKGSDGKVCGLKLRLDDGRKLCAKGSRLGLILSRRFDPSRRDLVVTEGESDLMVAASMGHNAVARPGCRACVTQIAWMARGKDLLVIADNDPAGLAGARALVDACKARARSARVVVTARKDLREWYCNGGTEKELAWLLQSVRGY